MYGSVYYVETERQGDTLADYETNNYQTTPCYITFTNGGEPGNIFGHVFEFCENEGESNDGSFDLQALLGSLMKIAEDSSDVAVDVA